MPELHISALLVFSIIWHNWYTRTSRQIYNNHQELTTGTKLSHLDGLLELACHTYWLLDEHPTVSDENLQTRRWNEWERGHGYNMEAYFFRFFLHSLLPLLDAVLFLLPWWATWNLPSFVPLCPLQPFISKHKRELERHLVRTLLFAHIVPKVELLAYLLFESQYSAKKTPFLSALGQHECHTQLQSSEKYYFYWHTHCLCLTLQYSLHANGVYWTLSASLPTGRSWYYQGWSRREQRRLCREK